MIGRLNHVAIVVPDLTAARTLYRDMMGATVSAEEDLPEHGVTTVFVELPNTKIELLHPLGEKSPIQGFLDKNPSGGVHHLCYEVAEIDAARDQLVASGARILGDGEPRIGAHGKLVLLLRPRAPERPRLLIKAVIATAIACVITGVVVVIVLSGWIDLRE